MKTKDIIVSALMLLAATTVQAQITIGGNVFGGARQADVKGNGSVTIHGGTVSEEMITITGVYGGNDIAGTVTGGSTVVTTDGGNQLFIGQLFGGGNGDYEYTAVLEGDDDAEEHVGKYRMTHLVWDETTNKWITEIMGYVDAEPDKPEITNAAINLKAGTFGYVYGGGNAATVTGSASITLDIPAAKSPLDINGTNNTSTADDLIYVANLQAMGINTEFFDQNGQFHISRLFGGNNKAAMAIQPSWHLNKGKIENLYSGGNEGKMISETGLLLEINPQVPDGTAIADIPALKKQLVIENVFGGCRKADVDPCYQSGDNIGKRVEHVEPPVSLLGYNPPRDFAARVRVFGGDIKNIYGGNDVSGHVYFGNSVGVYTSIRGNIYGGGNGSYAYTDNANIKEKFPLRYGDFYYDPTTILSEAGVSTTGLSDGMKSAKALNLFRPDAEQVSILVSGSEGNPTIVGGSIYCGGNSATLKIDNNKANNSEEYPNYPIVELKVGSYVVANEVFLGNNGADMVKKERENIEDCVLYKYAHGVDGTSGEISESSDAAGWLDYSKMDFTDETVDSETKRTQFDEYMEGCAMGMVPRLVFNTGYVGYSTYIGSLYCGGNVGSMTVDGLISIPFNDKVVIFEKVVGGCNNANVAAVTDYNAAYNGGLLNSADATTGNKLELTFNGLKIQPKRWNKDGSGNYIMDSNGYPLLWNTVKFDVEQNKYVQVNPITSGTYSSGQDADDDDLARRLSGGNIYGGCYASGHVNGNVVINLDATIIDRDILFDEVVTDALGEQSLYGNDLLTQETFKIKQRHTGVILGQQGMDVLGKALNVFGGGYGKPSEIWGSTTINLNKGYAFQVFGGGEAGAIGKGTWNTSTEKFDYTYDPKYSCFINLKGQLDGVSKAEEQGEGMAESEFIYGGGFFGTIAGNTVINLGKGRVFNTFGGSCNADILGHTETYIGRHVKDDCSKDMLNHYLEEDATTGEVTFKAVDDFYEGGFPYVRDIVYGGNDLGGEILGESSRGANGADCNFSYRVNTSALGLVHNPGNKAVPDVLKASAYVEYTQGRADAIFGGCFGTYDYTDSHYGEFFNSDGTPKEDYTKPRMNNAFVNFRPVAGITSKYNWVKEIYGAGQGYPDEADRDKMQNRSYVLIDIPQEMTNYQDKNMKIFGAGAWGGLGMGVATDTYNADKDKGSAIIDLVSGKVGSAYGASYKEGFTRRTVVNVPGGITSGSTTLNSTIDIQKIFGGGEGVDEEGYRNIKPCDAFEANINYNSPDAIVRGAVYGGNNAYRRTLYGKVNINAPVHNGKTDLKGTLMTATVYGAGCGENTWSQYTEVNLLGGAEVFEVYGGGEKGRVLNKASLYKWKESDSSIKTKETDSSPDSETGDETNPYADDGLDNALVKAVDNPYVPEIDGKKYNTNVHIYKDAIVNMYLVEKIDPDTKKPYKAYDGGYAYGAGLGDEEIPESGDVLGTSYIDLLGGTVKKDIYGAGTQGAVIDKYGTPTASLTGSATNDFIASSTVFIGGGTVRNVYGGGWAGDVGTHPGLPATTTEPVTPANPNSTVNDVLGETTVIVGIRKDQNSLPDDYGFFNGIPAIQRNVYSGGEGGAVFGTAHLVINHGAVGYEYDGTTESPTGLPIGYKPKVNDETYFENGEYAGDGRLEDCGHAFGGGYDDKSSVDFTDVTMWGGVIRNNLHGGGEIATVGRGKITASGQANSVRTWNATYKHGKTSVTMFNGHVRGNVFGGGKGYNLYGYGGKHNLYSDGYVFGQTEVIIHGGEVGTVEGVADNRGNVFGGGNIGFVYGLGYNGTEIYKGDNTGSPNHNYYYDSSNTNSRLLTEDCKVVIAPWLQVRVDGAEINGTPRAKWSYVNTDDLNTLPRKEKGSTTYPADWQKLFTGDKLANGNVNPADPDERGVLIHNAVFGGGNVSSNSDQVYANATTVFGNTTATLYDVYHRDFITVGTEHVGGLYGGGNLSMVNGYRELNITNYGTDYYGQDEEISYEVYKTLTNRERVYFKLEYKCIRNCEYNNIQYTAGTSRISEEEYNDLNDDTKACFEIYGFCSIYAGRLLNTIQRADFCGVYGSRLVLQGAKDRVADVGENIDYTINRVGEVSLNKKLSVRSGDTGDDAEHGNYFGIYSIVNHLGNLTSDVKFGDPRVAGQVAVDPSYNTYYAHKKKDPKNSKRNDGQSMNHVALASGVYLELTTENSTKDHKDYGYITGVVELDLINVKKEEVGGGFVYAKNEHRVPRYYPGKVNVLLSEYNKESGSIRDEARTYKRYRYSAPSATDAEHNDPKWANSEWPDPNNTSYVISGDDDNVYVEMTFQTSGNFIHRKKTIVDDCYPTNNAYILGGSPYSEAHYWYVKGEVYIYDQKVSAYTGSATAYSKEVKLPLTITAASHGQLQLLNVKPNLYAYYATSDHSKKIGDEGTDGKPIEQILVNNESEAYGLNDVITWWDWHNLSPSERNLFVAETYVNCVACIIDNQSYEAGEYVTLEDPSASVTVTDLDGEDFEDGFKVFRSSNNISHESGYVLTFDMNTPKIWDDYYTRETPITETETEKNKISKAQYDALLEAAGDDPSAIQTILDTWREGPTFTPKITGTYGKGDISVGDILTEETVNNNVESTALVERAYVAKEKVILPDGTIANKGYAIRKEDYDNITDADIKSSFDAAMLCTNTVKLSDNNYLLYGELYPVSEISTMLTTYSSLATDISKSVTNAYICYQAGSYGGQRLEAGKNYSAIRAWCSLKKDERIDSETKKDKFTYNFDALDLLTSSDYLEIDGIKTPDHAVTEATFHQPYTDKVSVEYRAVLTGANSVTRISGGTLSKGDDISNTEFETDIRNDQLHYTHVDTDDDVIYVALQSFDYGGMPYGKGQLVDAEIYNAIHPDDPDEEIVEAVTWGGNLGDYYCYENYNGGSQKGDVLIKSVYKNLPNDQQYFTIQGEEPTERTTLYVSRESDINDVSKEKIITVVYQYTYYEEEDDDGSIKLTNELHVINIHLQLETGAPYVGLLDPLPTVIPGNSVGLQAPKVDINLYEPLENGWEIFYSKDDADHHRNGATFENGKTPLYWYQNGKNYIAFYTKTYLGKTYSQNYVAVNVANYHDLDKVMQDKVNHMYVDRSDVDRPSKIYLDDRECVSDPAKSELDLFRDFFDLSVQEAVASSGETKDHALLDKHVRAGRNLEFFLSSDLSPKKYSTENSGPGWTPIGNNNVYDKPSTPEDEALPVTGDKGECFDGTLHGDGYTISGLDKSLFAHLCGDVFNLGVMGSFTGSGIADEGSGYLENCWMSTTNTAAKTKKPLLGTPIDLDATRPNRIVNCYYQEENEGVTNPYTNHDGEYGIPTKMPKQSFYNGEVAYNLNGFYLFKRYCDQQSLDNNQYGLADHTYSYYVDDNGSLTEETGHYEDRKGPYLFNDYAGNEVGSYVESRFADGDFRYSDGFIPSSNDIRMKTKKVTVIEGGQTKEVDRNFYYPIWPDDYIFFGQRLNYNYDITGNTEEEKALKRHQEMPSHIIKKEDRVLLTNYVDNKNPMNSLYGNRVYRAPAYFRSGKMAVAHFNPNAVFAQTKKDDATTIAYKGMTAIDFTGGNNDWATGFQYGQYANPTTYSDTERLPNGAFFPPLLDDDGLVGFQNVDLTKNLLVYTGKTAPASATTDGVVATILPDLAYVETNSTYKTAKPWDKYSSVEKIYGHRVELTSSGYVAQNDHFLMDKEDFNAPIGYSFATGMRMWYQREPENYVGKLKDNDGNYRKDAGWEGISLPFTADIVTTDVKGEITHFYKNSRSVNSNDTKTGHEYWLREFTGGTMSDKTGEENVIKADMRYPGYNNVSTTGETKEYTNTFLWKYYYSYNSYDDANSDNYQEKEDNATYYYKGPHTYDNYLRLANGTPYIIGFPGERYYEFDLSGAFSPKNTLEWDPTRNLDAQKIIFSSKPGATTIAVSDTEKAGVTKTVDGKTFTFKPSYLNDPELETGYAFLLNADGNSYEEDKVNTTVAKVSAFRPYFTSTAVASTARPFTRSIIFNNNDSEIKGVVEKGDPTKEEAAGTLNIYAKKHKIIVESALTYTTDVRIVNLAGITINSFTIEPGESVETRINNAGVYIVESTDGRYIKKLSVR